MASDHWLVEAFGPEKLVWFEVVNGSVVDPDMSLWWWALGRAIWPAKGKPFVRLDEPCPGRDLVEALRAKGWFVRWRKLEQRPDGVRP